MICLILILLKSQILLIFFANSSNIEYINLNNSRIKSGVFNNQTFIKTAKNLVLCTTNEEVINLKRPECSIMDCSVNWRDKQKKLINDQCYVDYSSINTYSFNSMSSSISLTSKYETENNYKYYENYTNVISYWNLYSENISQGTYYKNNIFDNCDPNCKLCSSINFCSLCMEGYYNLYINSTYSYCDMSPDGFYLDKNDLFYKQCYSTCKSCKGKGDELNIIALNVKINIHLKQYFLITKIVIIITLMKPKLIKLSN